jgi:phosphatidylglycerol:prolipoprotein diacylglycerol transferase
VDNGLYSSILGFFAAIGMIWSAFLSKRNISPSRARDARFNSVLNSGLILLAGMLIGARLSYAIVHVPEFADNPWRLLDFRAGGLDWMGLALGGVIALLLYIGFSNRSLIETLDLNFPLVALTTIGIWLGAQVEGMGYGSIHNQTWWVLPVTDAKGYLLPRIPIQAFGALLSLLFLFLIDRICQTKKLPKVKLLLFCLLEFGLIFSFSYFRDDPMVRFGNQPLERIAAAIYFLICSIGILFVFVISRIRKREF